MALTADQIQKLWVAEQESANPRYALMSDNAKAAFDASLNDYYTQNSQTILNKYSGASIDTEVGDAVTDDSDRTAFTVQKFTRLLPTNYGLDPNADIAQPLYDNIHWRIIWWVKPVYDLRSNITKFGHVTEVWIFDSPPSNSSAILIDRMILGDNTKVFRQLTNDGMPNIDDLDGLIFNNTYMVVNIDVNNIAWIPIANPFDSYVYWNKRNNWIGGYNNAALSGGITSQQILNGLSSGAYDPFHPEAIHAGWLFEKTVNPDITNQPFTRSIGGPVVHNVKLNILFMGNWSVSQRASINRFHTDVFNNNGYMNIIKQYGVNSGKVIISALIGDVEGGIFSKYDIQQNIQGSIDRGELLQPDADTFYMCYLDNDIIVNNYTPDADGIIAYHDFFKAKNGYNCRYGVIRKSISASLDIITHPASKMLINGITDPELNAWVNEDLKELCDVCSDSGGIINGPTDNWTLNSIWSVATRSCTYFNTVPILFPIYQTGLIYHDGPIVANSKIVMVFIGDYWSGDPMTMFDLNMGTEGVSFLREYIESLATTGNTFLNILRQYGILTSELFEVKFVTGVSGAQTKASIRIILQNAINSSILPEPDNQLIYLCFLDGNIDLSGELGITWSLSDPFYNDITNEYNDHFMTTAGHSFRYGVIKTLDPFGTPDSFYTVALTRTFADILTNPDGNGWFSTEGLQVAYYGDERLLNDVAFSTSDIGFGPKPIAASLWDQHSKHGLLLQQTPIFSSAPFIQYHNGPIVATPNIFIIFIGDGSNDPQVIYYFQILLTTVFIDVTALDSESEFFRGSTIFFQIFMNVLRQYGVVGGSVHPTPIVISGISGSKNDADIQGILQNAINSSVLPEPDQNNIYLCYVDHHVTMFGNVGLWGTATPVGTEYIGHFVTTGGHSCRYAVIKNIDPASIPNDYSLNKPVYAIVLSTAYATKAFANLITNPDGDGWFSTTGVMIADVYNQLDHAPIILEDASEWPLWKIYDDYNQGTRYGAEHPITQIIPSDALLPQSLTRYIWRITELEAINHTFRLQVDKGYNPNNGLTTWSLRGIIVPLSYDDWVTKYIAPYLYGTQFSGAQLETIQQIPTFTSIQEVLDNITNRKLFDVNGRDVGSPLEPTLLGNNGTTAMIQVVRQSDKYTTFELYLHSDDGWILIIPFTSFPTEQQIENAINYRTQIFNAGDKQITWTSGIDGWGNLTGQVSRVLVKSLFEIYTSGSPDPTDPNAFYPNRYIVQKFNEDLFLWFDKGYPWEWQLKARLGVNDRTNLRELFWGNRYDFVTPSTPDPDESNDPSLINPYWSIESTTVNLTNGNTIAVWNLGAFCADPYYRLIVELIPWRDSLGHIGVTATPIAYVHTELDGVVRQVAVQRGFKNSPNTNSDHSGFQYELAFAGPFLPNNPLFKLYFDTYTQGKSILPVGGFNTYDNTQPLLIQQPSVYGFHNTGEVAARYPDCKVIYSTSIDILIEDTTKDSIWTIRLYFKFIPYIQWSPAAVFPAGFENNVGGVFLHQMYLFNKGFDKYEGIPG